MQEEPLQGGMLWAPVTRSRSLDATAFYLSSDAGPIMWLMVGTKVTQLADDGAWSLGLRLLSATSSPKFKLQKAGIATERRGHSEITKHCVSSTTVHRGKIMKIDSTLISR